MLKKTIRLSQHYEAALRSHLKDGSAAGLRKALSFGARAVALKLDTLALARIHEQAMTHWGLIQDNSTQSTRARAFFTEAIIPIVETHRAAREHKIELHRLKETLKWRNTELATTNRQLQRGIIRRKKVEAALKNSGVHYTQLLKKSMELQEGLRKLTHHVLQSQEEERINISRELHADIAQTLLGINVRLTSLKQEARLNTKDLKREITSTQQLVTKSTRSVRAVARKISGQ